MRLFDSDHAGTPEGLGQVMAQARTNAVGRRGLIAAFGGLSVTSVLIGDLAGLVTLSPAKASANGASPRASSSTPAQVAGKSMTTGLPRTPEEFFPAMQERFNSLDVATALTLFRPDAIFVDGTGTIHRGIAHIGKQLETFFSTGLQIDLRPRHVFTTGDTALSINDWSYDGKAKDGAAIRMSGSTSDVLRRCSDGVWRYEIDNPFGNKVGL